ncbi:hypothetical protein ElyMa_003811700 [Elysia marginata]|uniref:Uncharacterized protein n=1 Tax=Elysia marginata TaxID=1093978 RepID=A0AAV4FGA1_9GAST|nr:hypothetical protein ElyMa_003811700 [Elysia marginata]
MRDVGHKGIITSAAVTAARVFHDGCWPQRSQKLTQQREVPGPLTTPSGHPRYLSPRFLLLVLRTWCPVAASRYQPSSYNRLPNPRPGWRRRFSP